MKDTSRLWIYIVGIIGIIIASLYGCVASEEPRHLTITYGAWTNAIATVELVENDTCIVKFIEDEEFISAVVPNNNFSLQEQVKIEYRPVWESMCSEQNCELIRTTYEARNPIRSEQ